jgi:hypothetical protein
MPWRASVIWSNENKQERQMREMEIDMQKQRAKEEERVQRDMKEIGQIKRKQEEKNYYNILAMQAKEKQYKVKQDKEADKNFSIAETVKLNREEQQRNQFFNKLKKIQHDNDQKHDLLKKYMDKDPAVLSSKKDEQSYLKNIQISEKQAIKKEFTSKQSKDIHMMKNNELLGMQLQEK